MQKALILGACGAALLIVTAGAVPISITVDPSGALLNGVGVADKAQYVAIAGQGNSVADNFTFLTTEIDRWNGLHKSPPLGPATQTDLLDLGGSSDFTTTGDTFKISSASGLYDYVVFHFGAGNAGQQGWWEALNLRGMGDISTLTFEIPKVQVSVQHGHGPSTTEWQSVGGISSGRFFFDPPVPDGGMTIALLGLALAGVEALRRKVGK